MSRYHYWQFLVNQEGQPIKNAEIKVYLAGSNTAAYVYRSEFGSDGTSDTPQVYTNKTGYFEFWLGDSTELNGYPIGQKFKLQWDKENVASGSIDWVDIYPGFEPVDETDSTSTIKNKLVSNELAYDWQDHISHQDVSTTSKPTFRQIEITDDAFYDNEVVKKQYVDTLAQGMVWQNPVNSFYDPSGGLPTGSSGDRYIASATANGWTEHYIYEYNEYEGDDWIEIEPIQGYSVLVDADDRHYHYNGTEWVRFSTGFAWYKVSTNTTMINRNGYLVDCSSNAVTMSFPSSPDMGNRIDILDYTANSFTNNITLDGNGNSVEEQATFTVDVDGAGLQLVYTEEPYGWKVINEVYA